jgi:hypothetical protein
MKPFELMKVTVKGREDIGIVTEVVMIDGKAVMTADFGAFTVSAPADFFTLVIDREAA